MCNPDFLVTTATLSRASSAGQVCAAVVESVFCQLLLFLDVFLFSVPNFTSTPRRSKPCNQLVYSTHFLLITHTTVPEGILLRHYLASAHDAQLPRSRFSSRSF